MRAEWDALKLSPHLFSLSSSYVLYDDDDEVIRMHKNVPGDSKLGKRLYDMSRKYISVHVQKPFPQRSTQTGFLWSFPGNPHKELLKQLCLWLSTIHGAAVENADFGALTSPTQIQRNILTVINGRDCEP